MYSINERRGDVSLTGAQLLPNYIENFEDVMHIHFGGWMLASIFYYFIENMGICIINRFRIKVENV